MHMSIHFDPTADGVDETALALATAYGYGSLDDMLAELVDPAEDEPAPAPVDKALPGGWTKRKMTRYVSVLKPTARQVLRAIAKLAPEATIAQVQDAIGLAMYQYAGSMSSFGFAVRNTRGVNAKPFTKDGSTYLIDTRIAALALEVLDEFDG